MRDSKRFRQSISIFVLFFFLSINVFSNTLSNIPCAYALTNNERTQDPGEALHAIAHEGRENPNPYEEIDKFAEASQEGRRRTISLLAVGLSPDFGYIELCKRRSCEDV